MGVFPSHTPPIKIIVRYSHIKVRKGEGVEERQDERKSGVQVKERGNRGTERNGNEKRQGVQREGKEGEGV